VSHRLFRRQLVSGEVQEVFDFFKDPYNLEAITPPWLAFRVLRSSDAVVRLNTRISYKLRLHGIPLNWESRIAEFVDGESFADVMLSGPYRRWHHRHSFRRVPEGVEMLDTVDYALPFGPLGRLTHALVVRRQLAAIFDYRAARIAERFPGRSPHQVVV
jgi:ligand-binding SRPBCC domain-containing protein